VEAESDPLALANKTISGTIELEHSCGPNLHEERIYLVQKNGERFQLAARDGVANHIKALNGGTASLRGVGRGDAFQVDEVISGALKAAPSESMIAASMPGGSGPCAGLPEMGALCAFRVAFVRVGLGNAQPPPESMISPSFLADVSTTIRESYNHRYEPRGVLNPEAVADTFQVSIPNADATALTTITEQSLQALGEELNPDEYHASVFGLGHSWLACGLRQRQI